MFSPDNWYVIGDAACIFDAFYSLGTSVTSLAMESVTEIVRTKLAGEANAETKRSAYNEFNVTFARVYNILMRHHAKHLGNASVMSWRIYFENMFWFGMLVPLYVGKWHLDLGFIALFLRSCRTILFELLDDVQEQFSQIVEKGINIGLMNCYRSDQLLWGYHPPTHFDDFIENAKYEPQRCNVFANMKYTFFYMTVWYAKLRWKASNLPGVLAPRSLYSIFSLLTSAVALSFIDLFYRFRSRGLPSNSQVAKMRQEFKSYQYRPELQPWTKEDVPNEQDLADHQVLARSL
jgi:hypothetical protein